MSEPLRSSNSGTESQGGSRPGHLANLRLAAAHLRQADSHGLLPYETSPKHRIPTGQLDYWWHPEGQHEVLLAVSYQLADIEQSEPEIVNVDVQQVDYRPPTDCERKTLQTQFCDALDEGGTVWEDLAATIWASLRV